jgi:cardiolipin synthase (CMP-forming)
VSGVVLLSFDHGPLLGQIPLWLTGTIIGRDLLILVGMVVIQMTVGKVKVRPRMIGKIATVLQMASVLWLLLKWDAGLEARWFLWVATGAAVSTGVSGLYYVYDGVRQLGTSPKSFASEPPGKR